MAGLSAVRLLEDWLSLSTYFLCLSKSDLFLKPQLSLFLKRALWVHRALSLIKFPQYFHSESPVGFWSQPLLKEPLLGPSKKG